MITDKGRSIITKFLAGQTSAYASYIAVGCGRKPGLALSTNTDRPRKVLDFEMVRVPVTSISIVNESGVDKVVYSSELPTQNRYGITEVGLFPAASNPIATSDSRIVFDFTNAEGWEVHDTISSYRVPDYSQYPLSQSNNNIINLNDRTDIEADSPIFSTAADDVIFKESIRKASHEQARMFSDTIWIRGNTSQMTLVGSELIPGVTSSHMHYNNLSLPFDANSSVDTLKLAYAINAVDTAYPDPSKVNVIIQFAANESETDGGQYATFQISQTPSEIVGLATSNAYFVGSKTLSELIKTELFTWSQVRVAKIYASTELSLQIEKFSTNSSTKVVTITTPTATPHMYSVGKTITTGSLKKVSTEIVPAGTYTITAVTTDTVTFTATTVASTESNVSPGTTAYANSASGAFYVTLDGMRFDNIYSADINPLYGLVAYSTVSAAGTFNNTAVSYEVIKDQNENSYIQIKVPVNFGGA